MDRVDLWRARLAMKTLRRDQRQAIAEAAEHSAEDHLTTKVQYL